MKIRINSLLLAYDDNGIGLPVIFLHAFPLNRQMWAGEVQALLEDQRYRLVRLDWRGFGESEIASSSTSPVLSTMDTFADDVAGLMDQLGISRAVLCGLSMGGYVAFAFAHKYPERLSGLILADTRPGTDIAEARANREKVAQLAENEGTGVIADIQLPRLISDYTRQYYPPCGNPCTPINRCRYPPGHRSSLARHGNPKRLNNSTRSNTMSHSGY